MSRLMVIVMVLAGTVGPVRGDDWPQWLGPKRDGVWREQGTIDRFPAEGPKVKWRVPVGGGYAGAAVAAGRVFVMDRQEKGERPKDAFDRNARPGIERVLCLNEKDGKEIWKHEYAVPYTVSYGSGPRVTPTVDGERVYTLGAEGHLICFNVSDGKIVWEKKLVGPTPLWGYSGHPLVDGDRLFVLTSGAEGAITAFDKNNGEQIWTALPVRDPGYAPPMVYEAGGTKQLIVWHPQSVNSLDPATGKVHWTQPFGPVQNGVSIPTPMKTGDLLFISSAWDGGLMMKLDDDEPKATVAWKRGGRPGSKVTDALHALMATPVIQDGHIYGVCAMGELRCLKLENGERVWETFAATVPNGEKTMWATAFLTPNGVENGGKFFIANEHGELIIARLTPKGYEELSRAKLLEPTNRDAGRPVVWCHPAYANRAVYWRNDKELVCVSLGREQTAAGR